MNILFKALDDPTRRKILDMLKNGDMSAGEIADEFDMTKPSISHHLDILKQSKLVLAVKKGQYVNYSLNTTVVDETISWLFSLKNKTKNK